MKDIKVFKTLTSTNEYLKNKICEGVVFSDFFGTLALEQTGGVGKRSRAWHSPVGNLYISFVVDKMLCKEQDLNLSLAEVVLKSVVATGRTLDLLVQKKGKLQYKWPNDVLFDGKKIAGILIEKLENKFIIGIGVNLNAPPKIKDYATIAVCDIIREDVCVLHVAKQLKSELEKTFELGFLEIRESFLTRAYKFHETIRVNVSNRVLEGDFVDISAKTGALVLQIKNGLMQSIYYGEIF